MNEIELKIKELADLIENVPAECKGDSPIAHHNRRKFLATRLAIHELQDTLAKWEICYNGIKQSNR